MNQQPTFNKWYNKDEIYCFWVFIWAILSILFPKYYPYYPSYLTGVILFISGYIGAYSAIFTPLSKLLIILYHILVLLGYYIFKRDHNICIDILVFIIYMIYYLIKYKKSPYYTYMRQLNFDKKSHTPKITAAQLISPDNIS